VAEEVLGDRSVKGQELRDVLATMLFRGDDIDKCVELLSGGERARVRFAQLLLDKPNVLVLDEPTNHLDIASCEALERALASFEGTILCVSHDRYFLDRTIKRLLVLEPPDLIDFSDTYSAWVQKLAADREDRGRASAEAAKARAREAKEASREAAREASRPAARPAARQAEQKPAKAKKDNPYARPFGRLSMKELEQQITDTEVAIAECHGSFGESGALKDPSRAQRLQAEYNQLDRKLKALEAEYFARGEAG